MCAIAEAQKKITLRRAGLATTSNGQVYCRHCGQVWNALSDVPTDHRCVPIPQPTAELCPRTYAIWQPGIPQQGIGHSYTWTGNIPCTGVLKCYLCGHIKPKSNKSFSLIELGNDNAQK